MDGTQQLVAVGGIGLVAANFWTGQQRPRIVGVLWGDKGADPSAGHAAMLGIGGELLLVVLLVLAAGMSQSVAYGMLAIIAALWVLWGIHYYGSSSATAGAGGAGSSSTSSPKITTA